VEGLRRDLLQVACLAGVLKIKPFLRSDRSVFQPQDYELWSRRELCVRSEETYPPRRKRF
jgi:hypothetical protein